MTRRLKRSDEVIAELRRLGVERGARSIARSHGMELEKALGDDRHLSVARTRTHVIACVTWSLGLSSVEAARVFGLHHTSVLHHLWKRETELKRQ